MQNHFMAKKVENYNVNMTSKQGRDDYRYFFSGIVINYLLT